MEISLGSCYEVETLLDIGKCLGFGDPIQCEHLSTLVISEIKMLHVFIGRLSESIRRG
jgi:four helix bundle protein